MENKKRKTNPRVNKRKKTFTEKTKLAGENLESENLGSESLAGESLAGKGSRLFVLLLAISMAPIMISIVVIAASSFVATKENVLKTTESMLYVAANNLSMYCDQNDINAMNASNYNEYLDSLMDQGIEMAILMEGIPATTSIKNENGYRIRDIEMKKTLSELGEGYYDDRVIIEEKDYFGYYAPVYKNGRISCVAFAGELKDNYERTVWRFFVRVGAIALIMLVCFAAFSWYVGKKLSCVLHKVGKDVSSLSKGNLDLEITYRSGVSEINRLIDSAALMQKNLAQVIGKVKDTSASLLSSIEQVTALSKSNAMRADQITGTMEDLTRAAVSMDGNVQDINSQMMEIGNFINDISDNVTKLGENSREVYTTNEEAMKDMQNILKSSEQTVRAVSEISTQIKKTNDAILEINQVVDLILTISEQTKLLSLNASIEAAKAGEQGRGFAVVAEEIRNLSDQSAEGAEMIKMTAKTIVDMSQISVSRIGEVNRLIHAEQTEIEKTRVKYEELSTSINSAVKGIDEIAGKTDYLADSKEKVIDHVQGLSAFSQENSASNETVSEHINAIMREIQVVSDSCDEMSRMAKQLDEACAYFHEGEKK